MRVVYESFPGTDLPWVEAEVLSTLKWVETVEVDPAFFGLVQNNLNDLWKRLAVALANYEPRITGFKAMVTNSALTVYPQV